MTTIVSIIPYPFLPAKTGGQKAVSLFYKYLSRHFRLVCISTKKNDLSAAKGYEVWPLLSNSRLRYIDPFTFFRMRKIIRRQAASHLILEHPYYGWLGVLLKRWCGVKLIVRSHNIEGLRWKILGKWWWRILWKYERWVHRCADYNIFIQDQELQYAIRYFSLDPDRCHMMTYGMERDHIPEREEREKSRKQIRLRHEIADGESVLLFNGAFRYGPNLDGLLHVLEKINPALLRKSGLRYKILICGGGVPAELSGGHYPNLVFTGFVDDIDAYFMGADVFMNPITTGGGIKTKLVEALGNNLTSVSARSGAIGIDPAWCNGKLLVCEDHAWENFAELVVNAMEVKLDTPNVYFEHFFWGTIAEKTATFIGGGKR